MLTTWTESVNFQICKVMRLLTNANLCWWQEPDEHGKCHLADFDGAKVQELRVHLGVHSIKQNRNLEKVIVSLDFDFR